MSAATCIWFVFWESDFGATAMGGILALGIFQLAFAYIFMAKGIEIVRDHWRELAKKYGISRGETERMEPAFRECE